MINLDFQTSKVNLLFNCMWVAQNDKQHDVDDKTFANMYPFFIGYLYRNEENIVSLIEENMKRNRRFSSKKDSKGEYHTIYSAEAISKYFKDKKDMTPYEFSNIDFNKDVEHFLGKDISHTF